MVALSQGTVCTKSVSLSGVTLALRGPVTHLIGMKESENGATLGGKGTREREKWRKTGSSCMLLRQQILL